MSVRDLTCERASGPTVEAPVLVSMRTVSPRYDLDRQNGVFAAADIPILAGVEESIFEAVHDGDVLLLEPHARRITLVRATMDASKNVGAP